MRDLARVSFKISDANDVRTVQSLALKRDGSSIARCERAIRARVVDRIRRSPTWSNLRALKTDLLSHLRDVRVTLAREFIQTAKQAKRAK